MKRWLRIVTAVSARPALHFVLLGGLLYAAMPRESELGDHPERQVVISAQHIHQLTASFRQHWGQAPSRAELEATVAQAVDERLLELEARRLALDFGDSSVRQRLIQKMRAVGDDPALGAAELYQAALDLGLDDDIVVRRHLRQKMRLLLQRDPVASPPSEQDLAKCLERHRDSFQQAATVSFSQVFISRHLHGERLTASALEIASQLDKDGLTPATADELSDPFPLASDWHGRSQASIARQLGEEFAEEVMAIEPGTWSSPIESPFGLHLVWIRERRPERLPSVDDVRPQLAHLLEEERAATRLAQGLDQLRGLYQVRVEWPSEIVDESRVAGS